MKKPVRRRRVQIEELQYLSRSAQNAEGSLKKLPRETVPTETIKRPYLALYFEEKKITLMQTSGTVIPFEV